MAGEGDNSGINGVADTAVAITPNDGVDIALTKSLYVGGAGALVVRLVGAPTTNVTFGAVPAGTTLPIRVVRVLSSGTAASSIVGLY